MDPNLSTTWQFGSILITVPPGRHRGAKLRLCCNFNKTRQSAEEGGSVCVWGEGEGGGTLIILICMLEGAPVAQPSSPEDFFSHSCTYQVLYNLSGVP